jgi:site-specific DNA-methyltransferase (adenine-specific)
MLLLNGDCLEMLDKIQDKSIQLICIDPPYNIHKAEWDIVENYNEWLMKVICMLETKLKDNGSFCMFHNDMEVIAELMVEIKKQTRFKFRQMIVWNKRFEGSKKKGFLDGYVMRTQSHNWEKMCEYLLFYTFDNTYKIKQKRLELNISALQISNEIKSKNGNLTGWYSNIELGKNMPTLETIKPITKYLGLSFDDIVPKFRNQKTHHSIWNYDIAKRSEHITPKPIELYKNLILHLTDEGDVVLDPTFGSGNSGRACIELGRKYIGIEKDEKFFENFQSSLKAEKKVVTI